jgi:hypothetical protein
LTWSLSGCVGVEFNPEVGVGVGVGRETTEGDMMRERERAIVLEEE